MERGLRSLDPCHFYIYNDGWSGGQRGRRPLEFANGPQGVLAGTISGGRVFVGTRLYVLPDNGERKWNIRCSLYIPDRPTTAPMLPALTSPSFTTSTTAVREERKSAAKVKTGRSAAVAYE